MTRKRGGGVLEGGLIPQCTLQNTNERPTNQPRDDIEDLTPTIIVNQASAATITE